MILRISGEGADRGHALRRRIGIPTAGNGRRGGTISQIAFYARNAFGGRRAIAAGRLVAGR
jgi:hypothetical protein